VSWAFIDEHADRTKTVPGYWRKLSKQEQDAIARRFWEVGRLTLEHWITPRLGEGCVHRRPGVEVVAVDDGEQLEVTLSDSTRLAADYIVFACGYRAELGKVPYLAGVIEQVELADGFPVLDEGMQTTLDGLYVTGFSATRDFGPFMGFVKGSPAAATLVVGDLLARS